MNFLGLGFLNLALLGGALAAAVPVLIHLLSRRRHRTVAWGAMFLIEDLVREDRRRVELKQWLLLAMRCLAILLLAAAMARPVLTAIRSPAASEPAAAAIVIDTSYSMAVPAADGRPLVRHAVDAARQVATMLPEGSDVRYYAASPSLRPIEADQLEELIADAGPADFATAVASAAELMEASGLSRREVIVLSDFQANTSVDRLAKPEGVNVSLVPVSNGVASEQVNVTAQSVTVEPATVAAGVPARVVVEVRNTGAVDVASVGVVLRIDGTVRDRRQIALRSGASATVLFQHTFLETGPHVIAAEVEVTGDILPADNVYTFALPIPAELPVIVVAGETGLPFGRNPADYLGIALDPSHEGSAFGHIRSSRDRVWSSTTRFRPLIRPNLVTFGRLSSSVLEGAAAVVLADVPTLSDEQVTALRAFVEEGGALLVFPGTRTDVETFNDVLQSASGGVLPARLAGFSSSVNSFAGGPYVHPALQPWNEPGNGDLTGVRVDRHWRLAPGPQATTLLTFQTGEPAIVAAELGLGMVVMAAIPADGSWSNLPLRSAFLPVVQQLMGNALSHSRPVTTLRTGETIVVRPPGAAPLSIEMPSGQLKPLTDSALDGRRRFGKTEAAGLYSVLSEGQVISQYAVNLPRSESDLSLTPELAALAEAAGVDLLEDASHYMTTTRERQLGREVWRPVLAVLLVTLFAELLLAGRFSREVQP